MTWAVWLCVLVLDALVFALAILTTSLAVVIGAIVLTVVAMAVWLFRLPADVAALTGLLVVIGGFAVFLFTLSLWRQGKLSTSAWWRSCRPRASLLDRARRRLGDPDELAGAAAIAVGGVAGFLLLILVVLRLPLDNPSPVFGLALVACSGCSCWGWFGQRASMRSAPWRWRVRSCWSGSGTATTSAPVRRSCRSVGIWHSMPCSRCSRSCSWWRFQSRVVPWAVAALTGPCSFRWCTHS